MALNNQDFVLLTATTQRDFVVIDLAVNAILYKLSIDSTNETECGLEPSFVSENLAALCDRNSGSIFLHDVRASKTCGNFSPGKEINYSKIGYYLCYGKRQLLTFLLKYICCLEAGFNSPLLSLRLKEFGNDCTVPLRI